MMTNKYFEITKKATIDYKEGLISADEFKNIFEKLDKNEVYDDLKKNGYVGVSNYISAIQELDDQNTLESQWIVKTIDLFYAFFTYNYDCVYSKYFYKFLKIGLGEENKNPVKTSFSKAIDSYLNNKISNDCLAYIANEFLNNLKFFKEELNKDKELFNVLKTALKLKFNRILEDLTQEEIKSKQDSDKILKKYLNQ